MAHTVTDHPEWIEYILINAGTDANITSDTITVDTSRFHSFRVVVDVGTAASVVVQGRLITSTLWVPLNTAITADGAINVDTLPQMRVVATGVNGALTVGFRGDRGR